MNRPALYTEVNSLQHRDAKDFFDEYEEEIGSMSGRCIDIGSGPGDVTVNFFLPKLKPNSTVMCSDISEAMVNYAKETYGDNDRLSFAKLDIETPHLPKDLVGQFDHAVSLYCIQFCHDIRQALKNINNLLRPGGTAFLTLVASCRVLDAFLVLQNIAKYRAYMKEAHRIIPQFQHDKRPRKTMRSLLIDAGFEVNSCSLRTMNYIFDTADHLKGFLLAVGTGETQRMPTDLHDDYAKDLMREALKPAMYEPALYSKTNFLSRRDARNFCDEYSKEIESMSGRCIDIGSGPGDVAIDFILPKLKQNSTLVCSDISEVMVNYAKKNYGNDDRLSFLELDIETPGLPKNLVGQFDHVTSFYCLHWCLDLRQAAENIFSLLRSEGTAFLTFLASSPSLDAFVALQAVPKYQFYMKEAHRIIPPFQHVEQPHRMLMTLLTEAGFEISSCSYRTMNGIFDNENHLTEFFMAVCPFEMERMPVELRNEFIKDLTREIVKREFVFHKDHDNTDTERSVLYRYSIFVVYVKKP